jgi:DNA-binding response OmpR family regulator
MKVLLLENNLVLSKKISIYFRQHDINCIEYELLNYKIEGIELNNIDFIILDIESQGYNGFILCNKIRDRHPLMPIMILSNNNHLDEKLLAFKCGADDFLLKPFEFPELLIRIQTIYNRLSLNHPLESKVLKFEDLVMQCNQNKVLRSEHEISLKPKEYKLLKILLTNVGSILDNNTIMKELWSDKIVTSKNTLEVYINALRNKIDKGFEKKLIKTKTGFGYYIG